MAEHKQSRRLRWVGLTILVVVIFLDLAAGIYHLTHEGVVSGVTQLAFGGLLVTAGYLILGVAPKKKHWRIGLAMITVMASVFFYLSFYHLTHEGLPSAIIEFIMGSLLAVVVYIGAQLQKS